MELNFDDERERLQQVRLELMGRVAIIDSALEALAGDSGPTKVRAVKQAASNGRSGMSAKARKAASLRMKAYWAKRRREERAK
jgi:hypothetical protein